MPDLHGVLEASPNAVLLVDREGVIQQANRNVPAVLGYDSEELQGMVVEDLLRETDRTHHVGYREEYMNNPRPRPMGREIDLYALHKDGHKVPVEISLGPIRQDGKLYVLATIADVSKRKERERELQRQNERLDEFTSVVSHDLRNPLSVATGRLELATEDCENEDLDRATQALDRMEALIEETLTLARAGRTVGEQDSVELAALADQCWRSIETAEAKLIVETEATVRADEPRLRQLLENLFRNAVVHGGTEVTVHLGGSGTGFFIEDNGPGIPQQEREEIFEAGYSTNVDGTGFGLNIVREIAEAHGWDITVTESAEGGARFEFSAVKALT